MASRDTEAARSLMEHVPEGYRNVERYRVQCDTYDALCARGVVDRDGAPRVRAALARVLGVGDDDAMAACRSVGTRTRCTRRGSRSTSSTRARSWTRSRWPTPRAWRAATGTSSARTRAATRRCCARGVSSCTRR